MTDLTVTTQPLAAALPAAPCAPAAPATPEFPEALFVLLTPPAAAITLAAAPTATATAGAATPTASAEETAVDDAGVAANMLALLGVPVAMVPPMPPAPPLSAIAESAPPPLAAAGAAPAAAAAVLPAMLPAAGAPTEKTSVAVAPTNLTSATASPAAGAQLAALAASVADGATKPEANTALPRVDAWLPPAPAASPAAQLPAAPPVTVAPAHAEFAERFASSVLWSVGQKLEQAEIRLHPRELGPVTVSLSMRDDQASITFSAAHPAAREAITQALPVLRDMFTQQGMNLAQAQVFDQATPRPSRPAAPPSRRGGNDQAAGTLTVAVRRSRRVGLLDDYA